MSKYAKNNENQYTTVKDTPLSSVVKTINCLVHTVYLFNTSDKGQCH